MLLPPDEAELFFKLHRSLLFYVNQRLNIVPGISSFDGIVALPAEGLLEIRNAYLDEEDLIETFVDENPVNLSEEETDIVLSWRHHVTGTFYLFRQLKKYMVFLSSEEQAVAYGVVGLTQPFEDLIGPRLPVMTEALLLPFKDKIVFDGLLSGYNISLGGGIKRMLNDSYRKAKERQGIVLSLPVQSIPISATTTKKKTKKKKTAGSKDLKPVLDSIHGMVDEFCSEYLNKEYAGMCRKLTEKLARKRPSPLLRGKPKTWACGIIRTIGWVNFLDDCASQPHLKLTAIDKALGVGQSTGQGKSMEIRKMLKIRNFDVDWTLPSRMDDNLMAWMIEVDGFAMDVRRAPREIQVIAFEQGLIPYIPADRNTDLAGKNDEQRVTSVSSQIFQFKITLNASKPAIWRRIHVKDCTLDKLHKHIQTAMGWTNSHLYQFIINKKNFGDPQLLDDGFDDFDFIDSTVTKLSDVVPEHGERFRFLYEYDFGDSWEHEMLFEGCPQVKPGQQFPLCLEGQRACPPEDVGGVWGYQDYLEAIADPKHEEHAEHLEWSGPFDPNAFDATKQTQLMRQGLPAWR